MYAGGNCDEGAVFVCVYMCVGERLAVIEAAHTDCFMLEFKDATRDNGADQGRLMLCLLNDR